MHTNQYEKDIVKHIRTGFPRFDANQVFSDFVEWAAYSIRLAISIRNRNDIEKRLQDLEKKYDKQETEIMAEMFALFVEALQKHTEEGTYEDSASIIFNELEVQNKNAGQFFTPFDVALISARACFDKEKTAEIIEKRGYVSLYEPAVGGGGMVLAFAQIMRQAGFNPTKQLLVYAGDIDMRCVCMTYIQTSLYGLPGKIQHGNALSMKAWALWHTPVYVFDLWMMKERRTERALHETCDRADGRTEEQDAGSREKERITTHEARCRYTGDVKQLVLPGMRP